MKQRLRRHWPLLVVVVLAVLLRLPLLNGSFWMDEAAQALESARPWSEQLQIQDDFQPPLLHLIVAVAIRDDNSEWWLRTCGALIPGILTIVGTYFVALEVGKWVFKPRLVIPDKIRNLKTYLGTLDRSILLASLTTLLLATSSFHIFYSQELRQYSLPAMWGIWSWWVLLKMSGVDIGSRSWWKWGVRWVVLSTLGLYSSYLYPFLLISQIVWIVLINARQKLCHWFHWLVLSLLILIAFLPWLPSFLGQLNAGQMLRLSLPGWETVVSTPQLKALALVGGKFLFGVSDITPNPYFAVYTLLFFGAIAACGYWFWQAYLFLSQDKMKLFNKSILLLLIAFFVPLITAWLVSFIVPILQPKRVLYLIPFWYLGLSLLIGIVVANYQSWKIRIWPVALLSLLLIFNLGSTMVYWLDPNLQRENWRQLWNDIDNAHSGRTPKIFLFDGPFASWRWIDERYSIYSSMHNFSFMGTRTADPIQAASLIERATNNYTQPTVIYFDYLTDLTDPDRLVLAELDKRGYKPAEVLDYPNIGFVRVFRK